MHRSGTSRWTIAHAWRLVISTRRLVVSAVLVSCVGSVLAVGASTALAHSATLTVTNTSGQSDLAAGLPNAFPALGGTSQTPTSDSTSGWKVTPSSCSTSGGSRWRSSGSTGAAGSTDATANATSGGSGSSGLGGSGSSGSGSSGGSESAGSKSPKSPFTLPRGFAPVALYNNLVENSSFSGPGLPSGWLAGLWNYGFDATQFQPAQVTMIGSSVALTAIKKTSPEGYPYQSGWISTAGTYSFQYGMIDFRAKMPAGQGLWSGLWMASASGDATEIDVQEMLLGNTHTVYSSLHDWDSPSWSQTMSTSVSANLSAGFHDYQLIWQPGMLTWAVDGVAYAQYSKTLAQANGQAWPFDNTSVYLIADLAVAGASDWGGPPNKKTVFPASMQIQSVKVWQ